MIEKIAKQNKPYIIATGASNLYEVEEQSIMPYH